MAFTSQEAGQLAGNATGYALGGAGLGATVGSVIPGIGTAIGAGIGGLAGLAAAGIQSAASHDYSADRAQQAVPGQMPGQVPNQPGGNAFTGTNAYNQQTSRQNPQQQAAINQLLPGTVNRLQNNQFDFGPIEQKSRQDFQKYTVPSLANRFSAFGGGLSSDAYQNALGVAQAEHELGLSAQKAQYGLQQRQLDQNQLGMLLQGNQENIYHPAQPGVAQHLLANAPAIAEAGAGLVRDIQAGRAKEAKNAQGAKITKKAAAANLIARRNARTNAPQIVPQAPAPNAAQFNQFQQQAMAQPAQAPLGANPFNQFQQQVNALPTTGGNVVAPGNPIAGVPASNFIKGTFKL